MSRASWRRSCPASAISAASSAVDLRGCGDQGARGQVERRPAGSMCSITPLASSGAERLASYALVTMRAGSKIVTAPGRPRAAPRGPVAACALARPRRGVLVDADAEQLRVTGPRSSAADRSGCAGRSAGRSPRSPPARARRRPGSSAASRSSPARRRRPCGDDWMLAPAEVPATTVPRSWAATIASPKGVPQMIAESLSWLPPVMKMPVAIVEQRDADQGRARPRELSGRTATTSAAPSLTEERVVHLDDLGTQRGGGRDDGDAGVAAAARGTNSLRMVRLRSLSSAPPMIIRGPTLRAWRRLADCQGDGPLASGVQAEVPEPHLDTPPARPLVVMRHAKAEPGPD